MIAKLLRLLFHCFTTSFFWSVLHVPIGVLWCFQEICVSFVLVHPCSNALWATKQTYFKKIPGLNAEMEGMMKAHHGHGVNQPNSMKKSACFVARLDHSNQIPGCKRVPALDDTRNLAEAHRTVGHTGHEATLLICKTSRTKTKATKVIIQRPVIAHFNVVFTSWHCKGASMISRMWQWLAWSFTNCFWAGCCCFLSSDWDGVFSQTLARAAANGLYM